MADIKETKRGTTPMLAITLNGVDSAKAIAKVEFLFKQKVKDTAETLVLKTYAGDVSDSVVVEDGVYYLNFTEAETRRFKPDASYFMDTRITYEDGGVPPTDIVELYSLPTLFEEVE